MMKPNSNSGMTLIEITVGMALLSSAILSSTLTYTSISKLQQKGIAERQVQQSGRYILEQITRDIRSSAVISSTSPSILTLVNTQDVGGSETYQYDTSAKLLYRCAFTTGTCNSGNGSSVGGDNLRISSASFDYHHGVSDKPFVKISMKVEQKDATILATDTYAYSYDISTVVSSRELQ